MRQAKEVLSKLLDENSRGKGASYSSVFRGWRDLAGLSLADHSRVYEIRHNNLFVEVDHNGWMQILLLRKARILSKLRHRYPELEIRDLKIRINPGMSLAGEPEQTAPMQESHGETGRAVEAPKPPVEAPKPPVEAPRAGQDSADKATGPGTSPGDEEVDRAVSGVPQESLRRQLKKLFLSSLKDRRRRGSQG